MAEIINKLRKIDYVTEFFTGWYRSGKYRILIFYEDSSYHEYYLKISLDYRFKIKGKDYVIIPERIIQGKNPMLIFYYNNPMPLKIKYTYTQLKAIELWSKEDLSRLSADERNYLENTNLDAKALNILHDAKITEEMFNSGKLNINWKFVLIALVIIIIFVIIMLQATGKVDFIGMMKGG